MFFQQPQSINQLSTMADNTANYYAPSTSDLTLNTLLQLNTLNQPFNDNLALLINSINSLKIGEMGQTSTFNNPVQHTCALNLGTNSASTPSRCIKPHYKDAVPADYMCHLCFSKEHFIRDCPQVKFYRNKDHRLHLIWIWISIANISTSVANTHFAFGFIVFIRIFFYLSSVFFFDFMTLKWKKWTTWIYIERKCFDAQISAVYIW